MEYFILSAYINTFTSMACCIFILSSNLKSKINQSFVYFTLAIAFWAALRPLWMVGPNKTEVLFFMRISMIAAIFIPITFLHFTVHLINEYEKHKNTIYALYTIGLLIASTGFSRLFITVGEQRLVFDYFPSAGPTFTLMTIEFIIVVSYGLFLIHQKLKTISGPQHHRLKHVFYGILITYIGGMTNFPLVYNIPILPVGDVLVSAYTVFITYAIFRYQLMDIRLPLKKSLVYTILITVITVLYLACVYIMEHIIQSIVGYKSLLVSMGFAIIIALVFTPLKNFIQTFIENAFFRGSYAHIAEENELLRREIAQTERLKSIAILAGGLAHEIKNPLTALKTFSEYLPLKMDDKAFLQKFASIINHEVTRIDTLVHELLNFAKPAAVQLKPSNIHNLLDQTLDFLSNDLLKHKIQLSKNYFLKEGPLLNLDTNQFKQALLNIILNAIDAMCRAGTLTIATSADTNKAYIKIQDNGNGIQPEDLPHIFDPFFTKKDHGTGLGLSITHEIIKNHNGKIFVESKIGKGTTFIIELPL